MKFPTTIQVGVVEGVQILSRETYRMTTSYRSEQPQYAPHTLPIDSGAPLKPIEMYDWMECSSVNYGYLTGVITLGILDPRDE